MGLHVTLAVATLNLHPHLSSILFGEDSILCKEYNLNRFNHPKKNATHLPEVQLGAAMLIMTWSVAQAGHGKDLSYMAKT